MQSPFANTETQIEKNNATRIIGLWLATAAVLVIMTHHCIYVLSHFESPSKLFQYYWSEFILEEIKMIFEILVVIK